VAVAVFSHWVLDFIVHRPDLPLYDDYPKVGLGLWNYPAPAFLLEIALLFGGMFLYLRSTSATPPTDRLGRFGMPIVGVVMLIVQAVAFFGTPPPSAAVAALEALVFYAVFAAAAGWLERRRA